MAFALLSAPARAEIGEPIEFIRVEGTQRVEDETVMAYMLVREGLKDAADLVDQSVKTLFSSGLFADVTIRRQDKGLIVTVVENPIVNRVSFEGNSAITDDNLGKEGILSARQIYTRAKVQDDVERQIELYRRSGRFAVRIEPKVIQLPQNRVDLVFEISEGPTTGISAINFLGNRVFSDDELRDVILTRESRWWRIFSASDNYDPDRVAYDGELLRQHYLSKGYADFAVIATNAELTRNGESFFVSFVIEEGQKYNFGEARISTSLDTLDIIELEEQITHQAGEQYDQRALDKTVDALTKVVGESGFAFANIKPRPRTNSEAATIDIEYVIKEGPRVYVERVNVNGNTRTKDDVIRREIRLVEGDAFNKVLLSRSERGVRGLNFFSDVQVTETPGTEDDKTIIDVGVREMPTGELSFGVGYSSAEDFTTQLSVSERNFLGRGQSLRVNVGLSNQVQRYTIGFTEPYFLGRDVSAGFSVFNTQTDYDYQQGLELNESGIAFSLGFPLSEDGRLSLFANFVNDELTDPRNAGLVSDRSYDLSKQEFGYFYSIDQRDDFINPSDGWNISFGQDIAGPGGDVSYLRTRASANFYEEIAEGWIFHLRGTLGIIHDYKGGPINYNDRFFRGGRDFRGFERGGVGPREVSASAADPSQGFALGANRYMIGTAQVSLPLGLSKESGVRANLFVDFGVLGETDAQAPAGRVIEDEMAFRATTGLSFAWRSPFGPVRFDFAEPLAKEDYDQTRFFRFTIGTSF
ncbi:outer membrane protein assembly factor BamA [Alphaproteobacteria bacterium]|nr:outer membrane protein assembly factor BamA [Alphaproteobacteria bacterium]MDB2393001.1 outer membrane protein assembly factor BamA [Alphaproteobacteria bacterium]MDB2430941.1 outer membrane protein assembly factor BamA [Alphaproteobacteria bacterium]MDB2462076.1 outer membrane protein assembly factor BamA [Alphaproteobacteria bacterium]MDB2488634.1 outer membrane protein assembly factor BamA [Alphaproteobacteria bacterium]